MLFSYRYLTKFLAHHQATKQGREQSVCGLSGNLHRLFLAAVPAISYQTKEAECSSIPCSRVHGRCMDPRNAARREPCLSHQRHVPNVNNRPKDFGSRLLHQTKCAHCHGKVASRPCEVLARAQLVAQLVATSLNERPVHDDNIAGTTVWPLGRITCPRNLI